MKAEEIIAIDIKTAQKVLNYQGPVFLELEKKIKDNQGNFYFEVRTRYCPKCHKKTKQEWVRNLNYKYWRCAECLELHLKLGIFHYRRHSVVK